MARYEYRAKEKTGAVVHSYVEAGSREEAIERISQLGYYPISVENISTAQKSTLTSMGFFESRGVAKCVTTFSLQLANLLKSGVTVLRAIGIISEQSENSRFRAVLEDISTKIKDGEDLSSALKGCRNVFDHFFVSMVQVGEENGMLPEALSSIAEYRKRQSEIVSKVKDAVTYPALVAIVGFFSILFILTNVMPKLTELIEGMNMKLPLPTVLLINTADFLRQNFLYIIVAFIVMYLSFSSIYRKTTSRVAIDLFKLRLPLFGKLMLQTDLIKFARTLGVSLGSGLQMLKCLELSISVMNNEALKDELNSYYNDVKSGSSLGSCMRKSKLFPVLVSSMILVGEESGRLTTALNQIAEEYEARVEERTKVIMALIEPAIILTIGLIVGFIVMALLLPVFQMDVLIR